MARYDYQCPNCGEITEEVHSMKQDPDIICDKCLTEEGEIHLKERQIGGAGTTFFFPGVVGRWWEENYRKYRAGTLTNEDETKVKEPSDGYQGGAKDYHTRS